MALIQTLSPRNYLNLDQGMNNIDQILESSMENQDTNTFKLQDNEAYAGSEVQVWQAMRFLNQLKAVAVDELLSGDRVCPICREAYDDPEKENISCVPVRLPCSHVLGKGCLAIWITPLGGWKDNTNGQWEEEQGWFEDPFIRFSGSADCPLCRRVFFESPRSWESAKGLEARLILWDRAYEKYMEFYRKANGDTIEKTKAEINQRWSDLEAYHPIARGFLFDFIMRQKINHVLTPTQARLQRNLEHISILELDLKLDDPLYDENIEIVVEDRNREENDTEDSSSEEEIDRQEVSSETEEHDIEPDDIEVDDLAISDNDVHM